MSQLDAAYERFRSAMAGESDSTEPRTGRFELHVPDDASESLKAEIIRKMLALFDGRMTWHRHTRIVLNDDETDTATSFVVYVGDSRDPSMVGPELTRYAAEISEYLSTPAYVAWHIITGKDSS